MLTYSVPKRMVAPFVNDLLETFAIHLLWITIIPQERLEVFSVSLVTSSSSEDAVKEWTQAYFDWPQTT